MINRGTHLQWNVNRCPATGSEVVTLLRITVSFTALQYWSTSSPMIFSVGAEQVVTGKDVNELLYSGM